MFPDFTNLSIGVGRVDAVGVDADEGVEEKPPPRIEDIPYTHRDYKNIAMAAVIEDPDAIKHVNPHNNNYNRIAMTAVMQDANAIKHVNMSAIKKAYREIALAAVRKNSNAFKWVSEEYKLELEIALRAVNHNASLLNYVPPSHTNYKEIALAAVIQDPMAIKHTHPQFVHAKKDDYMHILSTAVCRNPHVLRDVQWTYQFVQKHNDYNRIAWAAVVQNGLVLHTVDENNNDYKNIALAAVMQNGHAIKHVSDNNKDYREIALAAVMQTPYAIQRVDSENKDYKEIALAAVMQDPWVINEVDGWHKHYEEIALAAVMQDRLAFKNVNSSIRKNLELKALTSVVVNGVVVSTDPNFWTPMTNRIVMRLRLNPEDKKEFLRKGVGQEVADKYVGTLFRSLYSDRKFWLVYISPNNRPDQSQDIDYLVLSTDPDDPQTYTYENTTR